VGAWLHIFHKMPKKDHMQVRHQRREDYIESISVLTDFLASVLGERHFFEKIAAHLAEKAHETLPEMLPIGLGHGDYAMRNILVGTSGRVTVLDTFAKWQTPIYEDIGYFLTGLKMTYPQVVSQGLLFSQSQLMDYEQAFLKGYFGEARIPYAEVRLYEMLALLDKWSSILIWSYKRSSRKMIGSAKATLVSLHFKRNTSALLREITGATVSATSMDPERSY
jgi:aminoglycoside phosphotransferase (APT) family kinase protein